MTASNRVTGNLANMPGRLPVASDFPSSLKLTITAPPPSSPNTANVLILLHGLGDTLRSFTQLGKQLNLPETTCISLQATMPMPFELGGFHWGDDVTFSQTPGDIKMDMDTGFSRTSKILKQDVIEQALIIKCGYTPREIMFFGLGQGGMMALGAISSMTVEFAGVISIGGPFPFSSKSVAKSPQTPVLLLGGSFNTAVTRQTIDGTGAVFQYIESHEWNRSGDDMPRNREEMQPIMRFLARRLRSRQGVPEGSVEFS